jgi:hypothetical protein
MPSDSRLENSLAVLGIESPVLFRALLVLTKCCDTVDPSLYRTFLMLWLLSPERSDTLPPL